MQYDQQKQLGKKKKYLSRLDQNIKPKITTSKVATKKCIRRVFTTFVHYCAVRTWPSLLF